MKAAGRPGGAGGPVKVRVRVLGREGVKVLGC